MLTQLLSNTYSYFFGDNHSATKFYYLSLIKEDDECFSIHGLWPQYSDGGYPSNCSDEPFSDDAVEAVGMSTMYEMWPNVQSDPSDSDYDSFWEHEWTKHGTCSGLDQTIYFNVK